MLISCLSCVGKSTGQAERRNDMKSMKEIYLAGGCFWGTEHFLKQIEGVEVTQVGYAPPNIPTTSNEFRVPKPYIAVQ